VADILCDFPIQAPPAQVFAAISTPAGLDAWWTQRSKGSARVGATYDLWFPPDFDWRATVTACEPDRRFELEMTRSDADWNGTRVGFELESRGAATQLRFHHRAWPATNEHFRVSSFCWAMYLRLLRRHVEAGETVPYERRLSV
jgi:uncharacterized protein YndB with AHSA1/START domain